MQHRINKKFIWKITILSITSIMLLPLSSCNNSPIITNPYENVDWKTHKQYKANFHAHTTRSDGSYSPQNVVDMYKYLDYSILAITDHNRVTYPWTEFTSLDPSEKAFSRTKEGKIDSKELIYEDRNPANMGMIAVQGCEISTPQHLGNYLNDTEQRTKTIAETLETTKKRNGILIFNHPGRYKKSASWYEKYFNEHDHLIGLEVYNHGNRYPTDRALWDSILTRLMPDRKVWGFSNDDFHSSGHGRNWNIMILPELSLEWVRQGMSRGTFYYVYSPAGHGQEACPKINSIDVNNQNSEIKISCENCDSIQWISAGEVVAKAPLIQLDKSFSGSYIRAELFGKGGTIVGTQPFGIIQN